MKKQTLLLLGVLIATMSSCVYSLFPIYTEDTLVFKKELLGKWRVDDESYLLFEKIGAEKDEPKTSEQSEEKEYKYSIEIREGFTMSSDEPIFISENGRKIYNEDSIHLIMNRRLNSMDEADAVKGKVETEIVKGMKKNVKESGLDLKDIEYEGLVTKFAKKGYKLTIFENDESGETPIAKESYIAHVVDIGGDLFMDLYPVKEFNSISISDNFFPVHTFYKVTVSKDAFTMTHFDLDKLNQLFESNRIRLRHENVDGTILITAQPKELQKFIDKYSDDESVFDFTETYERAI